MKYFLALICLIASSFAEPTPEEIATSRKSKIISYVTGIRAEAQKAKNEVASLKAANDTIYATTGKVTDALISSVNSQMEAIIETAKVQLEIDRAKATIAKQAEKLERWQTFGRAVLMCVFVVTFGYAWQIIGKLRLFYASPYSIYLIAATSAGLAGSITYGLFYVITRLL